jgi:hypothetical protein
MPSNSLSNGRTRTSTPRGWEAESTHRAYLARKPRFTREQFEKAGGGGLIPILTGLILNAYGIQRACIYIGLLVMVYAVVAIHVTPETKGANLEDDVRPCLGEKRLDSHI